MSVKISELPSLETLADNDILAGVDTSEDTTSKITLEKIKDYTTEDVYDKEEVDNTIDALQTQIDSLSTIYNAFPTVSDEDESMTLDDTAEVTFKKLDLKGNTSQTGTPTPSSPIPVNVVSGDNTITIANSDNSESQSYNVNLGSLELCKIGDYQDYIYKEGKKWYLHKEIGKYTFTGNETFTSQSYGTNSWLVNSIINTIPNDNLKLCISNIFTGIPKSERNNEVSNSIYTNTTTALYIRNTSFTSQAQIQSATNGNYVYYVLATSTTTEITDTTLIEQLEALKLANSYESQTNISQENNDKPFILDVEAIKKLS